MDKREYFLAIVLAILLILFSIFSTQITFHDTPEYVTIAKNFAGIKNVDIFTTHSLLYPLVMSPSLKVFPAPITIKLFNCLWIFLIGLVLLFWTKNKKAFFIFALFPLVWYSSIQTTPVLPASFFLLVSYIFIKKTEIANHLLYSGISLGLSCAFYDPMILVSLFWIIIFFYDKSFSSFFKYLIFVIIGSLPRFILDYSLFHMPFYSLIRFFGTNAVNSIGLTNRSMDLNILILNLFLIVLIFLPFLFRINKTILKDNKKDFLFLILTAIMFISRGGLIKYFLIISPIIILLFSEYFTERYLKIYTVFSIMLIIILTYSFFLPHNSDVLVKNDLDKIKNDFKVDYLVAGPYEGNYFASLLWEEKPYVVWFEDFKAYKENKTEIRGYDINFNSKIDLRDNIRFSFDFVRSNNKTYKNYIIVELEENKLEGFKLEKCYESLCVYK